ncbi:hypothetical protein HRW09_31585, partial [Streptomyces lunaelactis]|uniref:hypothetical protein n=1 Tax=Streptomyces lunaelactis TaxID=1535768 RepID=UPI001584DAF0
MVQLLLCVWGFGPLETALLDTAQRVRRPQPGRAPAAEAARDQTARHRERHGQSDRRQRDLGETIAVYGGGLLVGYVAGFLATYSFGFTGPMLEELSVSPVPA